MSKLSYGYSSSSFSLSLSLPLVVDEDELIYTDHPRHTIMSLSLSLSVLSLIESSFVGANHATKHNETLIYTHTHTHTLTIYIYVNVLIVIDDKSLSSRSLLNKSESLLCVCV